ncbi:MAG: citrate synthase, partial [Myxococcales bacterium]|nr:citrate synthase [Myxococcales bacterium]
LYACVSAALAALSGPRHGGACRRVEGLLDEAAALGDPAAAVRQRFARGDEVPGFGHRLYPGGDPRAAALLDVARSIPGGGAAVESLEALESIRAAMEASGHPAPTLDFGLVAVAEALALPRGSATALFAIGRAAGWVAHILEQRRQNFLLRPTARYIGPGAEPTSRTSPTSP